MVDDVGVQQEHHHTALEVVRWETVVSIRTLHVKLEPGEVRAVTRRHRKPSGHSSKPCDMLFRKRLDVVFGRCKSTTVREQIVIVRREPFGKPEHWCVRLTCVVKRTKLCGTNALNVPKVEVLVTQQREQSSNLRLIE